MLFSLLTVFIYNLIKVPIKDEIINVGITAFLSSLVHSALVIVAMYLSISAGFANEFIDSISNGFWAFILSLIGIQIIGEAVLALIVTIPVVKALRKVID